MNPHTILYNGICFTQGGAPCHWMALEGERIVSDTQLIQIPSSLPEITLN